jgi:cytochrome c oxidase cbb3-type subunit 3
VVGTRGHRRPLHIKRLVVLFAAFVLTGCEREERQLRLDLPLAAALDGLRLMPNGISGAPPEVYFALDKPYESNAYDLNQGKRLYSWFECESCHGDGRGGIGPSFLMGGGFTVRKWSRSPRRSATAGHT